MSNAALLVIKNVLFMFVWWWNGSQNASYARKV